MESIIDTFKGSIKIVQFNKPKKKNAIDGKMYQRVINLMNDAATDSNISMLVLTGTGDFFSSGNDFSPSKDYDTISLHRVLKEFIKSFIMFPKLLVAIVNGPAIGIAATTLPLCDVVFASENLYKGYINNKLLQSYFQTPFTKLGIVAEGCSTFTFPRIIGERKAIEMLILNHKMSAEEALQCGLINYIYKPNELQSTVWDKIVQMSELPKQSVLSSKKLIRGNIQEQLLKANEKEINELHNLWTLRLKSKM